MYKLSILLLISVMTVAAQTSIENLHGFTTTENDSLAEVFPLSTGNEWTYNYSLSSYDEIAWSYNVSGTVTLQIIEKSVKSDSTMWIVQRTNNLNCDRNGSLYHDTSMSTFQLIEIDSGCHRVLSSEFPFYSMPFDSMVINKNAVVDSSGNWKFEIDKGRMRYTYTFKQKIGATAYSAMDMCTCLDYWYESYGLSHSHITGVGTHLEMNNVKEYRLNQNYPNPFNPTTTITFSVGTYSYTSLRVYDVLGREVATIVSEKLPAGNYSRQWNAANMPSGIYFYRLQAGSFTQTKKLILLK
jgi:hypothetical protein